MSNEIADDYDYEDYEDDECANGHRYAIATAEDRRQTRLRRDMEEERGCPYNEITFCSRWHLRPYEAFEKNPGLAAVINSNRIGKGLLTVASCALLPGIVDEAHHGRPLWVMHRPEDCEVMIDGCCFFFGLADLPLGGVRLNDFASALVTWRYRKFDQIAVPAEAVIDSLRDAEDGEGSVVIAYVAPDAVTVSHKRIPVGLVKWLEEGFVPENIADTDVGESKVVEVMPVRRLG